MERLNHPALVTKLNDREYERRYSQFFVPHLLSLLPLFVFAGLVYLEYGALPWRAVSLSGCAYLLVLACLHFMGRQQTLAAMRREGLVEDGYRPPIF